MCLEVRLWVLSKYMERRTIWKHPRPDAEASVHRIILIQEGWLKTWYHVSLGPVYFLLHLEAFAILPMMAFHVIIN